MYGEQIRRYPISDSARQAVGPVDLSDMITDQTLVEVKARVDALLKNRKYDAKTTDESVWTFFITALLMSRFDKLGYKFAMEEAERMKDNFVHDRDNRIFIFADCCGETLQTDGKRAAGGQQLMTLAVERYLGLVERYNLRKEERFKLVNQDLDNGIVTIPFDAVSDLFGACLKQKTLNMIGNLRKMDMPTQLKDLEATIAAARPQEEKDREVAENRKYAYIEELLKKPVPDGRHRLLWLVLAPYLVTIKKMDEAQAIEKLVTYAKASGDKRDLRQVVIANVRRAKRIKLKPPTLSTLRRRHQDVYDVLPPELKQRKQK